MRIPPWDYLSSNLGSDYEGTSRLVSARRFPIDGLVCVVREPVRL